jgi:hypothetical protein
MLHRYFAEADFETDEYDKRVRLLRELDNRKSDAYFNNIIKEYEELLTEKSGIGYTFFNNVKLLEDIKIDFGLKRGNQRAITGNILRRSEFAAFDFIINILNDIHNLKINKEAYNASYSYNLAEEIMEKLDFEKILRYIEKSLPEYSDILKIFLYEGLAFLKHNNDEYYFEFKDLFLRNFNNLSFTAKDNMFISLENICLEKAFSGSRKFIYEELEIYKERILRNAYRDETNDFNIYLFRNITLNAIACNEIQWLEDFIKKYAGELSAEFRNDMVNFATGHIFFEKSLFGEALKSISKINDPADIFKISLYALKLKIYYETNDINSGEYLLDSYNHYISLNKMVSERFRKSNKKFIKVYSSLLKIKCGEGGKSELKSLNDYIYKEKYFKEQTWLMEKINDLQKKFIR